MPHILCVAPARKRRARGYARGMTPETNSTPASMADKFQARAATFRRVANELNDPDERAELLRIAAGYEQDAERLRQQAALNRS